ncbi:hypothetical protein NCHU2750_08150 [Neorhizobium sp. NCHU2750]|nr:hypothetical protein NCHU2750_08150 [Neorhizobium sp. NCHU2750]
MFHNWTAMMTDQIIAAGDVLMIRRVYFQLRAKGLCADADPKVLAANLVYLYRIGVREEKQLLELTPYVT